MKNTYYILKCFVMALIVAFLFNNLVFAKGITKIVIETKEVKGKINKLLFGNNLVGYAPSTYL